jgi:plasmid maintenance system antidote protein VapI
MPMSLHNPPHPGEFIREVYLATLDVSARTVAAKLKVAMLYMKR